MYPKRRYFVPDLGGIDWRVCLASDLTRASLTAGAVFRGEVEHTALLREAHYSTFRTGRLRLPVVVWKWLLRLAWMSGHRSQRACRDEFQGRVRAVADRLCALEEDTLVVSHAGMIAYLSAELCRRGFAGPKPRMAEHARAYVYEKVT